MSILAQDWLGNSHGGMAQLGRGRAVFVSVPRFPLPAPRPRPPGSFHLLPHLLRPEVRNKNTAGGAHGAVAALQPVRPPPPEEERRVATRETSGSLQQVVPLAAVRAREDDVAHGGERVDGHGDARRAHQLAPVEMTCITPGSGDTNH